MKRAIFAPVILLCVCVCLAALCETELPEMSPYVEYQIREQSGNSEDELTARDLAKVRTLLEADINDGEALTALMPSLEELSLVSYGFSGAPNGLDWLKGLTGLKRLDVSACGIENLDAVSTLTGLEALDISRNEITDIAPLAKLKNLKELNIDSFYPLNLDALGEITALERLSLEYPGGDGYAADISPLAALTDMKYLSIFYDGGEEIDLSHLAGMKELRLLRLGDTAYKNIGALSGLDRLELTDTFVYEGGERVFPGPALVVCRNEEELAAARIATGMASGPVSALTAAECAQLDLDGVGITDLRPFEAFRNIEKLDLGSGDYPLLYRTVLDDLSTLAGMRRLREINLWGAKLSESAASAEGLAQAFGGMENLTRLNLAFSNISEFPALNCPKLERLDLSNCDLAEAPDISGLPSLKTLDISGCPLTGYENLAAAGGLKELHMDCKSSDALDAARLLPEETELYLYGVRNELLPELAAMKNLRGLSVSGEGAFPDMGFDSLTSLSLSGYDDISAVSELVGLTSLYLRGGIGDLAPISELRGLVSLTLNISGDADYSLVNGLTELEALVISVDSHDVAPDLSGLAKLRHVDISCDDMAVLGGLSGAKRMETLTLACDDYDFDLSFVSGMEALRYLNFEYSSYPPSLEPLRALKALRCIVASTDDAVSFEPLSGLTELRYYYTRPRYDFDASELYKLPRFIRFVDGF